MNLRPRRVEDPEINLISLIDVVLMLVIFFMVSSSFLDEGRVRIHLPSVERPDEFVRVLTAWLTEHAL